MSKNSDVSSFNMDQSACHSERAKQCNVPKPSWWWIIGRAALSAFLTSFLYVTFAVPAIAVFLGFPTAGLSIYEYGILNTLVLFVLGLIFYNFGGWIYYNPALAIAEVLCCPEKRWYGVGMTALKAFVGSIFALGGYFLGYWILQAIYDDFSLLAASPRNHESWFEAFYLETLGATIICHALLFVPDLLTGFVRVLAISVAQGMLIVLIYPATGGSLNFWRTLSVGALEGNLEHTAWSEVLVAMFVAPILTVIIKLILTRGETMSGILMNKHMM